MKPNEFNDENHEVIFKLLVFEFMDIFIKQNIYSYKTMFEHVKKLNILDLFPLEIAPEEFEGYVSDDCKSYYERGIKNMNSYYLEGLINGGFKNKIKFRFED